MDLTPDWLAISVASVLNMAIGIAWYSKWLFGSASTSRSGARLNGWKFLWGFLVSFVIAFFLDLFHRYLGIATVSDGMFLGFCLWLGFAATTQISAVIWRGQSIKIFIIDTGCKLLSLLVMSGVIGA